LNNVEIIETLANTLKKHKGIVYNVLAITTAKVPIVKFKHARTQLEGDISLYNTLVSDDHYHFISVVYCMRLSFFSVLPVHLRVSTVDTLRINLHFCQFLHCVCVSEYSGKLSSRPVHLLWIVSNCLFFGQFLLQLHRVHLICVVNVLLLPWCQFLDCVILISGPHCPWWWGHF